MLDPLQGSIVTGFSGRTGQPPTSSYQPNNPQVPTPL